MNRKRIAAGILSVILAFSALGCVGKNGKSHTAVGDKNLTLWYEASTVKLKQNDNGEAVKAAGDKNVLKIRMARNESEGVQLMLYAGKDITSYDVSVSDLSSRDGTIPAEDIDIWQVKYQEVSGNGKAGNPAFDSGMIPDPLLPMKTAVEYKEATIKKGDNQSIYLDVATKEDTPAGLYEGKVTVTTSEKEYQIPLEVTVYDVIYSSTPGLKTAFSYFDRDHFATAELDASDEQTTAYFETLLEYNMSSFLPYEGVGGIEAYLTLLRKYYNYDGFSSYRLYYDTAASGYKGKECSYNAELLKEYIIAIAKISVEDHINYLDKAYAYFYTVSDEPATEEQFMTAKSILDTYDEILWDADAELRLQYAGTEDYAYYNETVSGTLLNIPDILPGSYDIHDARQYGLENLTFVPEISNLHTESDRRYYTEGREDRELWTYSCVGPVYPYPSGHTDDYTLGFRLTSWMCFDYGWDGYLMWGVANYLNLEGGEVVADAWTTMDTGQGRPGDGKLFYPGEKYGLDEPCPSLRVMAYRDGTEDYELLAAVQDIYEEYGMDASNALLPIYESLYSGVIPITDSYVFEEVRERVFDMIIELKSDTGILYGERNIDLDKAQFSVKCVDDGAKVTAYGKELTPDSDGFYRMEADLTEQSDYVFTVSNGKNSKEYTYQLINGRIGVAEGFEEAKAVEDYLVSTTAGYEGNISTEKKFVKDGEKAVHLLLNKDGSDTLPYFAIKKDSKLIGGSFDGMSSMKFYLYNAGETEVTMEATYYTSAEVSVGTYQLPAGEWTLVEVAMPQDISDLDRIEEFDFNFEKGTKVELYVDSFVTIVEEE